MKLIYGDVGHIFCFRGGYVNELVVENRGLFLKMVNDLSMQADGARGGFLLSLSDKPVEFSKYADVTVQLAPFQVNRKGLLTKLYATLEQKALQAEHYLKTRELLGEIERFLLSLSEDLPFGISSQKLSVGAILKAIAPEIEVGEQSALERIFTYMGLVRELDRDRLFVMVNMRTYFSDDDMACFVESACLHDFKVLLLESVAFPKLKNTQRYTVDADLCEF